MTIIINIFKDRVFLLIGGFLISNKAGFFKF